VFAVETICQQFLKNSRHLGVLTSCTS
jgi:hypothetical protein